jgi:hypothetical protein
MLAQHAKWLFMPSAANDSFPPIVLKNSTLRKIALKNRDFVLEGLASASRISS